MNPANYTSVIRRSPSPAFGSNQQDEDDKEEGRVEIVVNEGDSDSDKQFLTVSSNRQRHNKERSSTYGSFTSELNNMANIETVVEHSINNMSEDMRHNTENTETEDSPNINMRRQTSYYTPDMEDKFRRKLKFLFMDPCSKWRAKRRWPWKLCLQVLKIFLITAQVLIFASQRSGTVDYFERNRLALKHIFLKDWEASYETMPYPPAVGEYAIYTKQNFYDHVNHIIAQYYEIPSIAIGTFYWEKPDGNSSSSNTSTTLPKEMVMCKKYYTRVNIYENKTFIIDPDVKEVCFEIKPERTPNGTLVPDIIKYLDKINHTIIFDRFLSVEMKMLFRSYHLDLLTQHSGPACFKTELVVKFDNGQRDGQMVVDLTTTITESECTGKIISEDIEAEEMLLRRNMTAYDSFVMIIVILSAFLCLRSVYRAQKMRKATNNFFLKRFGKKLSCSDQLEFLNLWYVLIIVNDILTLVGSSFKIMLENKRFSSISENYDLCSILLGVGSLMAWTGVLRYLGFFAKYNILIITLKTAFPNVLRFMVCALILYLGFMFCGWVILGPYHIKFRHLSTSSECLFSLVNGDDMFVTFSATQTTNNMIWYFSRVYLYTFISLFIYIVLSLFIAVIMDTYETLKHYAANGFPKSELFEFIDQCNDLPSSGRFSEKKGCTLFSCLPCCNGRDPDKPDEKTRLLNHVSL
ncbi:hypothetical protein SNE40_005064 [Patella caerulea]|uniref:Polycystin cation channel PKD1/PKD2 domain-containing protein n=2 Tax=Patella caerulea TaxID=87958 RepID=A0AAN8K499_PATCE